MTETTTLRRLALGLCCLTLTSALRADADDTPGSDAASAAFEMDRPGEVENPYSLAPGRAQWVNYLLVANPQGREGQELGQGGSASVLQTEVRLGIAPNWEAQVSAGVYLNGVYKGQDGDDPGTSHAGLGLLTLRGKWTFYSEKDGDFALALVPTVTIPTDTRLAGRSGAEPGLILPFDADLSHGFDLQGSASVAEGRNEDGGHSGQGELQAGIEYEFPHEVSVYLEPELEFGDGRPGYALEQGVSAKLTKRLSVDLGFNEGLGHARRARFAYAGLAVGF